MDYGHELWQKHLLIAVPEFRDAYEQHVSEYDGEVLSTVLIADFRDFLIDAWRRSVRGTEDAPLYLGILLRGLDAVDRAILDENPAIEECIMTGFLEGMRSSLQPDESEDFMRLLAPNLRSDLEEVDRFWRDMHTPQFHVMRGIKERD